MSKKNDYLDVTITHEEYEELKNKETELLERLEQAKRDHKRYKENRRFDDYNELEKRYIKKCKKLSGISHELSNWKNRKNANPAEIIKSLEGWFE